MLINNEVWTGIPGYCRFVLSVGERIETKSNKEAGVKISHKTCIEEIKEYKK